MTKLLDGRVIPNTMDAALTQLGYQQVTPTALSTLLSSIPAGTIRAVIQCNGGTIRWRADGTAATVALGAIMADGSTITLNGALVIAAFQHFLLASTPKLDIQFWG
jgi:hypothetical protein